MIKRTLRGLIVALTSKQCNICNQKTFWTLDTFPILCDTCIKTLIVEHCQIRDVVDINGSLLHEICIYDKKYGHIESNQAKCDKCRKDNLEYFKKIIKLEKII